MTVVEIIAIGTELLLGDIQDTNTRFIARNLKESGYDVFRISTVGDNQSRIAQIIREATTRSDVVITTGGLGPTVDDPTREAVAQAFNVELVFHQELWEQIESRFLQRGVVPTENNRKQALLPMGATSIVNKYGTAPGFIFPVGKKYVICLQGVPHEMERLFNEDVLPFLNSNMPPSHRLATRVLHTIGIGESTLDNLVSEFERLENPTVGLLAHAGIVDIRLVASAPTPSEAIEMIAPVEAQIRKLVSEYIFGVDDETIEEVISKLVSTLPSPFVIKLSNFPSKYFSSLPNLIFQSISGDKKSQETDQIY